MDYNVIATPIVGAIIGYTTNWIAIKMLFRPYTEKKIFGLRLPFTPGLIPKERNRIALSLGQVIEKYLLTDEVILDELLSESITNSIISYINEEIKLNNNTFNPASFFNNKTEMEEYCSEISNYLISKLYNILNDQNFIFKAEQKIKEKLVEVLKDISINNIVLENKDIINNAINNLLPSEEAFNKISEELEKIISEDKTIEELLGVDLINQIKSLIQFNEPKIKKIVIQLMENEDFAVHVKNMISEVISNKFGALGAMFVNTNSIYESIVITVNKKIDTTDISELINNYLDKIIKKPLYEVIPEQSRKEISKQITNKLLEKSLLDKVINYFEDMNQSLFQFLDTISKGQEKDIIESSIKYILIKIKQEFEIEKENIQNLTYNYLISWLEKPLTITNNTKNKISEKVISLYHNIVEKHIAKLIASAKLSNIIERQINSFEIKMFEEVIFSIVKKELNAITWLGALLGFIMSIILLIIK